MMPVTLAGSFASLEAQTTGWDEAESPGVVRINGTDYACALDVGSIRAQLDQSTMTTQRVQTATARIRRTLLVSCPALGAKVTALGREWFIESLGDQAASAVVWTLHLKRTA